MIFSQCLKIGEEYDDKKRFNKSDDDSVVINFNTVL